MLVVIQPPVQRRAETVQEGCQMHKLYSSLAHQDGQTMAEYATVLSVITIVCVAAFAVLAAASTGAIVRVVKLFT
jgi:Flp pilus assembly pilin Flp